MTGLDTGYTAQADGALQRATRQISGTVFRHDDGVLGVAVSPDGKTLFAAAGGKVHIWDVATGQEVGQLDIPPTTSDDPYWQITLSDDGSYSWLVTTTALWWRTESIHRNRRTPCDSERTVHS